MPKTQQTNVRCIIDGKDISVAAGTTILQAAKKTGIPVPTLCHHPDLPVSGSCRLCLVEIEGRDGLFASCTTPVEDGMVIRTASESISRARKINLELLFAQHTEECKDCVLQPNCTLLSLAREYKVPIARFQDRKKDYPVYQFGPSIQFDSRKCIDCGNCIAVCKKQGVGFLETKKHKTWHETMPSADKDKDCVYCGQCIVHCPVGAFEAVGEFEDVEQCLSDKSKTVVFQFAPSIRSSIGEEFGLPSGSIITEQLVGAIKALGVPYVFDTSVGADVTTIEEAGELVERLESGERLPMFTSCCPAWVRYVELHHPKYIPNLTTVRSPHIILGSIIKQFWASEQKLKPQDITVVSVMPCTSKKYEITREELFHGALKPVDYVLTTRELAFLLHKKRIDISKVKKQHSDNPLGIPSGAGVIYGASGGVMESALRTAYERITGKKLAKLDFTDVRGQKGIKRARVRINKKTVNVAVVNGLGNIHIIFDELAKNPHAYDYIEVMSCPGGCIGGGGQPIPTNQKIREQRAQSLYDIDYATSVRTAHENPFVQTLYAKFLSEHASELCYTTFSPSKKDKPKIIL
ncbi:MAG: [FeFe] hydrogenase, group A [Patescibacteria group bacterium]